MTVAWLPLLAPAGGCSFALLRPSGDEGGPCTSRSAAPNVDLALGLALSALAIPLLATKSECRPDQLCADFHETLNQAGMVVMVGGALELAAGLWGKAELRACKAAQVRTARCDGADAALCPLPWKPPPQ